MPQPTLHIIQRVTYAIAGQTVAVRVTGDPEVANNGLFYLYSDHLGSISAMTYENGNLVPGSTARYTPFGDWRTEPTAGLTLLWAGLLSRAMVGVSPCNLGYACHLLARRAGGIVDNRNFPVTHNSPATTTAAAFPPLAVAASFAR